MASLKDEDQAATTSNSMHNLNNNNNTNNINNNHSSSSNNNKIEDDPKVRKENLEARKQALEQRLSEKAGCCSKSRNRRPPSSMATTST